MDALGLPAWKHPQPHRVEWMYHTGKLKVTHKVHVKVSVGDSTYMVICDVIPMDACHLLLGWSWQYDHNAMHEGRTNTYSFWNVGKRRVLRPMFDSAIKVDDVVSLHKKVENAKLKPRTVSFKGGGDDVTINNRMKDITCVLGAMPRISQKERHACNVKAPVHATTKPSSTFYIGSICMEVPPVEPKKNMMMPNFRTPPRW